MTPQDREQFWALARRQAHLEEALAQLRAEFRELEERAESQEVPEWTAGLPPLPTVVEEPVKAGPSPFVDTVTARSGEEASMPVAQIPPPPLPDRATPAAEIPAEEGGGLEFQFGRWLARIGVVFALITLITFSTLAYDTLYKYMGAWSKLGVLALVSGVLIAAGLGMERRSAKLTVYGRTLAGGGLACLYYTFYGATYVRQLQVIGSPLLGGFLLLGWSAAVLYLAEKKKSELLSIFALALAYFSSAITPVGEFTMAANLILALTAVIFLLRNAWTGLSYLCLIGTYVGLLRQFVVYDRASDFWFEVVRGISFWPAAVYLAGAWVIYTAGIFLAATPKFAAGKRMAFLCLNNGALIGLLTLTSLLSAYGHIGSILCLVGGVFLATSYLVRLTQPEADELTGAYLTQGLALATGGVAIAYTGVTRGLLITSESVFLAAAGAYSKNRIFRIAGCVSALLGSGYLFDEITGRHFSWVLTFGGATAMLVNAWLARRDFWHESREVAGARVVFSSAYYILLALGLLLTGYLWNAGAGWLAPDLALTALILAASIYFVPLFELAPLGQSLLIIAQLLAFGWPMVIDQNSDAWNELGFHAPQWSQNIVALVTMTLVLWWPRQRIVRTADFWLQPMMLIYALAMVGFGYNAVHSHVDAQGWMVASSLLSLVFLACGGWMRTWQFMVSGQILLALSVATFLNPPSGAGGPFPWTWWAAAIPSATVFLTGWLVKNWLIRLEAATESAREYLHGAAYLYQSVAQALLIRWVFGVVPADEITLVFLALGTAFTLGNVLRPSAYGVRAGFVLTLIGAGNYLTLDHGSFTWSEAAAFLLFLAQPALLRRWGPNLVTRAESWAVIVISSAMAWLYVSNCILAVDSPNLTLGWAVFALALTVIGFVANERRQRWGGLVILVAAIIRVGLYDFWGLSDLYKVLTFFVLTVICLGLSFLYYRFADRLKDWL